VRRIIVDNLDEIDRLAPLVSSKRPVSVMVRVTPGVEAHTHEFVRTGQDDSKFGLSLSRGDADEAVRRLRELAGGVGARRSPAHRFGRSSTSRPIAPPSK
jgi:diaminopimelate decarboxylase